MEWLWHVDADDEPLGRVARDQAHAAGLRHRSGIVFLVDRDGRVYLTRRAATKRIFPSTFDSSASFHVSYGESYELAAQREAREELGLALPLRALGKFCHDDPPEYQHVMVFRMDYAGEPIRLDPLEAESGKFYTLAEAQHIVLTQPCTPWLRDGLTWLQTRPA